MKMNGVYLNKYGEKLTSFDLEDKIMQVWQTKSDIELMITSFETMDEDQKINALIGLELLCDMRFNDLWDTYEKVISNQQQQHSTPTDQYYELGN